ncbi:histidine--tRNA ligase [Candidatus Pacearchaeota archaeon]|nr:histidine--tRNA ligase [Candidatus Pacearchaeota archaeon]
MEEVKGFNDYTGEEARKREKIMKIIREVFELYGFEPAETPIIESEDFARGENVADQAVRDLFRLEDRGKRKLALRYEFTFQLKRISRNKKLPYKRFQIGEVFRDEPVKVGRTRQFIQCDADIIGSSIKDEAENFQVLKKIWQKLGIDFTIYINNRKLLNEILAKEGIKEESARDIIREIDKLDKLSEQEVKDNLKKYKAEKVLEIFKKPKSFFKKYDSYKDVEELEKYCKLYGVGVEFRPFLARGFSYYNGTVFEVWSKRLNVAICGGGSYLVNGIQSTGVSLGIEPISLLAQLRPDYTSYLILSIGQDEKAIELAEKLRENKISSQLWLEKGISKALEYANAYNIEKVVFIGEDEIKKNKFKVRDMKTGKESLVGEKELISQI